MYEALSFYHQLNDLVAHLSPAVAIIIPSEHTSNQWTLVTHLDIADITLWVWVEIGHYQSQGETEAKLSKMLKFSVIQLQRIWFYFSEHNFKFYFARNQMALI